MTDRPGARIARLLALGLFLLPALLPLLQGDALPCTHDNVFHLFRITAMREALKQGWLFSRWVPNLALGYGYPFFNYREPLPYWIGEGLYLAGLPAPLALGLLYVASLIASAWGAYALARALFGARAGWIAALAYSLAPYMLLDPLRRGNMPESVALALLPWIFLAFRALILNGRRRDFVAATLLLAVLFLSHNISSLLLAPFLGAFVIALAWIHGWKRRTWLWAFAAVGVALALTAWFWLPALAEQDLVQLHLSRTTRNNDFHYNFVTWREILLTPVAAYDADYLNPPMRIPLGLLQWALALVGLGRVLWRGRTGAAREDRQERSPRSYHSLTMTDVAKEQRALAVLFAVAALAYLWMATPAAVKLWDAAPVLAFVQFPWRLVGRALLPVCLLAGAAFHRTDGVPRRRLPGWIATVPYIAVLCSLALLAYPDTFPPNGMCPSEPYPDIADVHAYEQQGWMGMDPESSYFPIWVEEHPSGTALAEALQRGEEPARWDESAMPPGSEVLEASYRPLRATVVVRAPEAFQARWLGLYFPGWRVRIDGDEVLAAPEEDTGLLRFDVPAGIHEVTVRFGSTPLRTAGTVAAAAGLILLAVTCSLGRWEKSPIGKDEMPVKRRHGRDTTALALAAVLVCTQLLVLNKIPSPLRRERLAGTLPEVATASRYAFDNGIALVGATLPETSAPLDSEVAVDLLWLAEAQPQRDYRTTVLLVDANGQPWSPAGTARPRGYETPPPTTQWQPGNYAFDPHLVAALPGAPPGVYRIVVSLFDRETLEPASLLNAQSQRSSPELTIGSVELTRPAQPATLEALEVPAGSETQACGALGLWSMKTDRAASAPGDIVAVRWVWEALSAPQTALDAVLTLERANGNAIRKWHLPPATASWSTEHWQAGDRWVGRHVVRLPGGLDSGSYALTVALPGCEAALGRVELKVNAPERAWNVPEDLSPASVALGGQIELAGYALQEKAAPGGQITVRLAWRALTEMATPYRVYLHLLGPDGAVVSQDDGEPATWSRPTTGWAEGEVVAEERTLHVPRDATAGVYRVRAGLYEVNGPRLLTSAGDDGITLAEIKVR